jgi:hypothetical protein
MFTAYIDDSGTDPSQKVAIATALIIPARRIIPFQSEWDTFTRKWGVLDFHTSECAVANPKSDFAGWNQEKVAACFRRIRQITRKYGVKCFSLAVNKDDYDAIVPESLRPVFGKHHYTWAVHSLLALLDEWACQTGIEHPIEYIFDWLTLNSPQRREIEEAIARIEKERTGRFAGHYSFRHRSDYPGLQCVDLVGWTCYRFAMKVFTTLPLTDLQIECWNDFNSTKSGSKWLVAIGQNAEMLQKTVEAQLEMYGTNTPRFFLPILE